MTLFSRAALILGLIFGLAGCTNSPILLKALYGQFDNVMRKEMLSYADFTDAQEANINEAVNNTVRWHRTQALPEYVALLSEAQVRLVNQPPESRDIDWLMQRGLDAAKAFEERSPVLALTGLIKELSDDQVADIVQKLNEEMDEQREELAENDQEDPAQESAKGFAKFMKRLGLRLTDQQKEAVTESFRARKLTEEMRLVAWQGWTEELIEVLKKRRDPDFDASLRKHYTGRMMLIRNTYPELWQQDRVQGKAMLLTLFRSLDDRQREQIRERLALLSEVALDLAENG